jgi:glycosyltransferase involved in cell wall biosynthesis
MRLVILDSGLKGRGGHHYAFDMAVGAEARRRGVEVLALAHSRFEPDPTAPFEVRPVFSHSCYDWVSRDPVSAGYEAFSKLNPLFRRELAALPGELFGPDDLVWVPTTTENQLKGLLDWIDSLDAATAPRFVLNLVMPAGVILDPTQVSVTDPLKALYYRLLLPRIAAMPMVRLWATGRQLARDYGYLAKSEIETHPLLVTDAGPLTAAGDKCVLLYSGESSPQKGVTLLPELVRRLSASLPDWRLLVHANDSTFWQTKAPVRELKALSAELPNLDLRTGYLEPDAYVALLREATTVALTYNQAHYRHQTSGVLWEALQAGRPLIVPKGTYLEREASLWGASFEVMETGEAAVMAETISTILTEGRLDPARSMNVARLFREDNGVAPFTDALFRLAERGPVSEALVP